MTFLTLATVNDWGVRFRAHMKLHRLSQEGLAESIGVTQGAIGHWLNGRRPITLGDFFKLCAAAGANPQLILFQTEGTEQAIEAIGQILKAHPELNPSYRPFEKSMVRKKKRKAKAPAKVS